MSESEISPWVGPGVVVFCLTFSVVCGWWQVRRDNQVFRKTGEFPRREDAWGDVIVLIGGGALFVAALTMLKENREEERGMWLRSCLRWAHWRLRRLWSERLKGELKWELPFLEMLL